MGAIVYIACVVIVPVLLNFMCLLMLLRAACKRLRQSNGPQQASQLESPIKTKCPKQPAVQGPTHLVVMHPDHQIVCGRVLERQLSGEDKHNGETQAELGKAVRHSSNGGSCNLWVVTVPGTTEMDGQVFTEITKGVPNDSKTSESDRP